MDRTCVYLSIIVPCYNIEKYVRECVDSILAQTFTDFELILVDDGSTDSTGEICDEYAKKDQRVQVIHKKNGGLVNARKAGLAQAHGKYACYVDGDDFINPDMYERLCGYAKDTGADMVIGDFYCAGENETQNVSSRFEKGFYDKAALEEKIYPYMLCDKVYFRPGFRAAIWSKIYKRELLIKEQMQVDDEVRMGEDSALVFPALLQAESMYYAKEEYLYGYRVREDSMSHALKKPFCAKEAIGLAKHMKERFACYPQYEKKIEGQRLQYAVFMMDMLLTPHLTFKGLILSKKIKEELCQYRDSEVGRETIAFAKENPTSSRMKRVFRYLDKMSLSNKCNLYAFAVYERLRNKKRQA